MKYDKNMYYDLLICLGYASTTFDQWIHSITADDLDDILSHDDTDMNDVMIDLSNDESVPADWSGDYTDSIENIKRLLESWKD